MILEETAFPDVASLRERWAAEREAWRDYTAGLSDEALFEARPPMTIKGKGEMATYLLRVDGATSDGGRG